MARDPARRQRIIGLISELWMYDPDARLCQLVMNALAINRDPYFIEDDVLEMKLTTLAEKLRRPSNPG